jgi:glycosyltransferase involved in cell wall biosynthesis
LLIANNDRVITYTYLPDSDMETTRSNEVHYFFQHTLHWKGLLGKLIALVTIFHAPEVIHDLENIIDKEKPVIAHIHNIYHRFPYRIVTVLNKHNIKIIWWLHDYKWVCPNNQLFTQGRLCRRCLTGNYFNAIRYRCQKGSLKESIITVFFAFFVAAMQYRKKIDLFVAPSRFAMMQMIEFAFQRGNITLLPHFHYLKNIDVGNHVYHADSEPRYALYVGRIEQNKGLLTLVKAFGNSPLRLLIIGTGNSEHELQAYCRNNNVTCIDFLGYRKPEELGPFYRNSTCVVVPSNWYEIFGLTILEAFAFKKPVVAAAIGAIPEVVEDGKTGLLFKPGDSADLIAKVNYLFENPGIARGMGKAGFASLEKKFSRKRYIKQLHSIHHKLLSS